MHLDHTGKAGVIVVILADDTEVRTAAGLDGAHDIGIGLGVEPDGVGGGIGMRRHRLHVHIQSGNSEHAGMNIVDLIPELTCWMFLRLAETCHGRSFPLDGVRLKRHPPPLFRTAFSLNGCRFTLIRRPIPNNET